MLSSINQKICDPTQDYASNSCAGVVTMIPLVSIIVHKITTADLQRRIKNAQINSNFSLMEKEVKQLQIVTDNHIKGAKFQLISFVALAVLATNPVLVTFPCIITYLVTLYWADAALEERDNLVELMMAKKQARLAE